MIVLSISGILGIFIINNNPKQAEAAWYTAGGTWNYRQKITIDHTKVPNTDQTDFPVLLKITDQSNPVFTKAQSDGDDILFTSSNQTTKLSWEIEKFTTTLGSRELDVWVKISSLSHLTDTVVYLYYGNSAATGPSAAEKQAVWSNGYVMTQHMNDATISTITDSTSNANTGTKVSANEPTEADGKIAKAQSFDEFPWLCHYRKMSLLLPC
jgi:hypothetical protein